MALFDYNKEKFQKMSVRLDSGQEIIGEFTDIRIDPTTLPKDKKRFAIRHCDEDWGEPASLKAGSVLVNHFGDLIVDSKVEIPEDECEIMDWDFLDN